MNELMPGKKKFIRVTNVTDSGFIEFLFAIDVVTTNMELILPSREFVEFCDRNKVSFVDEEQKQVMDRDDILWKYGTEEF